VETASVRRHKPTEIRRVEPSAEVVEAGFGVAFFAGEFVALWAGVDDGCAFDTVGVEVGEDLGKEANSPIS
jgi:hypothetical protein